MSNYRRAGFRARFLGFNAGRNPYRPDTDKHRAWLAGWASIDQRT